MEFRQVHLDFHTSEAINNIGIYFDKLQFQQALIAGHVNSITLFSKCHHGWSYHPTKTNIMHPGLHFDLLGAQLEACKEICVRTPIYISAGHDEKEVLDHPEWVRIDPNNPVNSPFTIPHYHDLCYNTPYLDKLASQVEEVMMLYNPCEIFLDISSERQCVCANCVKSMKALNLDPNSENDRKEHARIVYANYCKRIEEAVRKFSKTTAIFHNAGHITHGRRDIIQYDSHLELESLPTGGWGYDHFPLSAAYARTLNKEFLGMTGKFHNTWGEFGGYKHPNALIYEACLSLACGAAVSIGDQLHPSGKMDMCTYQLIGKAYSEVEKKEPWCIGAKNHADIAVFSCEAALRSGRNGAGTNSNLGANRILLEGNYLFDFIDGEDDFYNYKMLILPDYILIDDELKTRLTKYLKAGNRVLLTGLSGLDEKKEQFAIDIGAKYGGLVDANPDYMIPAYSSINGEAHYIMYSQGQHLTNNQATIIAYRQSSYFNRSWEHYCSHQHAPYNPDSEIEPAATLYGNIGYISWNIFEDYAVKGELAAKELVIHMIDQLLGDEKTVKTNLPDRGIITLTHQKNRDNVHLLFAYTTVRGKSTEVIEDVVPLYNTQVEINLKKKPQRVYLAPQGNDLDFQWSGQKLSFIVPKLLLHQIVSVEF